MSPTKRIAHLWTDEGIVDVPIETDWPDEIQAGAWVYRIARGLDGAPYVTRGRFSGAEFGDYKVRRKFSCDDVPSYLEADTVSLVMTDGDAKQSRAHRSTGPDERGRTGRARPRGSYKRRAGKSARP